MKFLLCMAFVLNIELSYGDGDNSCQNFTKLVISLSGGKILDMDTTREISIKIISEAPTSEEKKKAEACLGVSKKEPCPQEVKAPEKLAKNVGAVLDTMKEGEKKDVVVSEGSKEKGTPTVTVSVEGGAKVPGKKEEVASAGKTIGSDKEPEKEKDKKDPKDESVKPSEGIKEIATSASTETKKEEGKSPKELKEAEVHKATEGEGDKTNNPKALTGVDLNKKDQDGDINEDNGDNKIPTPPARPDIVGGIGGGSDSRSNKENEPQTKKPTNRDPTTPSAVIFPQPQPQIPIIFTPPSGMTGGVR